MKSCKRRPSAFGAKVAGERKERVHASSRFVEGQFRNTRPVGPGLQGSPLPLLGEYFFAPQQRTPPARLPTMDPRPTWDARPETGLRATWISHSTVLLEMDGVRVLTDPVFGDRASPVRFAGPKRFFAAPVEVATLPRLDAILISHDHYDHLCVESVQALAATGAPFITSLGVGAHLEAFGVPHAQIVELDWWEEHVLPGGRLSFTATPAQHFSGRSIADRNATSWASWVLRSDKHRVFFSGDTGFTEEFGEIGRRLGPFDLVMLEIGAFHPQWGHIHLGPENALRVHDLLGGGVLLPVHWATFNLALHAWDEPGETLLELAASRAGTRLLLPRPGQPLEPARAPAAVAWWR